MRLQRRLTVLLKIYLVNYLFTLRLPYGSRYFYALLFPLPEDLGADAGAFGGV